MIVKNLTNSNANPPYCSLSLIDLLRKIVDDNDIQALEEFHKNRALFIYNGKRNLRFIDFITILCERVVKKKLPVNNAVELAEKAYDLTVDKFSSLPVESESLVSAKNERDPKKNRKGIDCRLYFKAFLEKATQTFAKKKVTGQIEQEALSAAILQGFVNRHFYLSRLEAERQINPFWSRYNWKIKGKSICIRLPISLKGRERPKWLKEHIKDPDPQKAKERQRIQRIIYQRFFKEKLISISDKANLLKTEPRIDNSAWGNNFGMSLAQAVAKEKATNINLLRRSIRALGEKKLRQLILRIFEDINQGEYKDGKVAKDFGLSKATFSRFAGSKWHNSGEAIPDLWHNTAKVLSSHKLFNEFPKIFSLRP